jgi:hyperosmotically inducible periplasmic protein
MSVSSVLSVKNVYLLSSFLFVALSQNSCWLGAGVVGGEAGYIASQEERSVGQTIDDQVIHSSIKSRLVADPLTSALRINVDVNKGYVTLRGYLKSYQEIERSIEIARLTRGVKGVDSRLILDD